MKRMLKLVLVPVAALVVVAPARAEMPKNTSLPTISGRAAVGEVLLGNNGTWLYADGSSCGPECTYTFRWTRCSLERCTDVSQRRGYRPALADLGRSLQVTVTATKYDCAEWNYALGTQECRWVSRTAVSGPLLVARRARVAAGSLAWPAYLRIERIAVAARSIRVTVTDTLGRLVHGAQVTVSGRALRAPVRRLTASTGVATVPLRGRPAGLTVTVRAGRQVARRAVR